MSRLVIEARHDGLKSPGDSRSRSLRVQEKRYQHGENPGCSESFGSAKNASPDDLGQPIDQNEFGHKFQDALRVLEIRPRPFYNTRHTYISVALTFGCNPKWIAEQTATSLAMIQQNYGKYIRDDGDALLRAYVERPKMDQNEEETETFPGERTSCAGSLVVPTGFEPVLPT